MGLTLAMAATLWSFLQQREKERELLFVGGQFQRAIRLYYEHTPGTVKRYPQNLEVLLKDDRYLTLQRYLRRVYSDPITGKREWGLVRAPDGGVMGIYSKSDQAPIKEANFSLSNLALEGQKHYSDWKFIYQPLLQGGTGKINK